MVMRIQFELLKFSVLIIISSLMPIINEMDNVV
jgi:hypothetical protein